MNFKPQHIKKTIFISLFLFTNLLVAQKNAILNETVIFTFNPKNGKTLTLNKGKENSYIVYRFGTKNKIEFEYSTKTTSSWKDFTYSFYLRGGGEANEGMDLNYVNYTHNNFKYVIYDEYYAINGKHEIGVKIINLITTKITNIKGDIKTQKGSLVDFRDYQIINKSDDIFE